jgi:aspartate racemase
MKTIGLIGGLSWQSTIDYYRFMNLEVKRLTQGRHTAKLIIDSVDFNDVQTFMDNQDYDGVADMLVTSARRLEGAGAELLMIGANTMHFAAGQVRASIGIPLISIMDATIEAIRKKSLTKVGLLGTKYTMEHEFFKQWLIANGIEVTIPGADDRDFIDQTIFRELFNHTVIPESKQRMLSIMNALARDGAGGIILGCTEIPIMIKQEDTALPVFDTTELHALAAVEFAMKSEEA